MEYIGKKRRYRYTSIFTIVGVYTAEDYFNLRDELKIELAKKKLAVFSDMNIFTRAFNETDSPATPLNEASDAWGIKIKELIFTNGEYIMEYNLEGKDDDNEISSFNVFMFYTMKNLGTGTRKRKSKKGKRKKIHQM